MVVVMEGFFPVNHALDVPKLLHVAWDCDCAFLIKPIFFLCLLQQLHKQRVIEVYHRHNKPLLFLTLAHLHCQTPFRNISDHLLLRSMMMMMMMMMVVVMMMMMMEVRQV